MGDYDGSIFTGGVVSLASASLDLRDGDIEVTGHVSVELSGNPPLVDLLRVDSVDVVVRLYDADEITASRLSVDVDVARTLHTTLGEALRHVDQIDPTLTATAAPELAGGEA